MAMVQIHLSVTPLDGGGHVQRYLDYVNIDPNRDTCYWLGIGSTDNVRFSSLIDNEMKQALRREMTSDELAQRLAGAVQEGDVQAAFILADAVLERYHRE